MEYPLKLRPFFLALLKLKNFTAIKIKAISKTEISPMVKGVASKTHLGKNKFS